MRRFFGRASLMVPTGPCVEGSWFTPTRSMADVRASDDELRKAYGVLGAGLSSDFKEVRKRYLQLAKEHHPDVVRSTGNGGNSKTSHHSMASINEAYSLVERHFKAGGSAPGAGRGHEQRRTTSAYSDPREDPAMKFYYNQEEADMWTQASQFGGPLHWEHFFSQGPAGPSGRSRQDDYFSAVYEMDDDELEAMRQYYNSQNRDPPFRGGRSRPDGHGHSSGARRGADNNQQQQKAETRSNSTSDAKHQGKGPGQANGSEKHANGSGSGGSKSGQSESGKQQQETDGKKSGSRLRPWTDSERDALANMYCEGKPFEFIANALGRTLPEVLDEYNYMSHAGAQRQEEHMSGSRSRRPGAEYVRYEDGAEGMEGYYPGFGPTGESAFVDPDAFFGDPNSEYFAVDEFGNIIDELDEDGQPFMYSRGTTMHGFPRSGGNHRAQQKSQRPRRSEFDPFVDRNRRGQRHQGGRGGGGAGNRGRGGRNGGSRRHNWV